MELNPFSPGADAVTFVLIRAHDAALCAGGQRPCVDRCQSYQQDLCGQCRPVSFSSIKKMRMKKLRCSQGLPQNWSMWAGCLTRRPSRIHDSCFALWM